MPNKLSDNYSSFRILVLDDEDEFIDLFKLALAESQNKDPDGSLDVSNGNFKCEYVNNGHSTFDVTFCNHSEEAVSQIEQALRDNKPYSLAFLDIRLGNSFDGVWAAEKIRMCDPHIEIVMITGFMDYSPQEIAKRVPPVDKIIYITKPFTIDQITHFAHALVQKWLNEKNFIKLRNSLEENNIALKILLDKREKDKTELGEMIVSNVEILLIPIIEKMKSTSSISELHELVKLLEVNVNEIISPFIGNISSCFFNLTHMETQVAHYVKMGRSNKEIANILGVGLGTILSHRHSLRKKLGITNRKKNLRSHLLSIENI